MQNFPAPVAVYVDWPRSFSSFLFFRPSRTRARANSTRYRIGSVILEILVEYFFIRFPPRSRYSRGPARAYIYTSRGGLFGAVAADRVCLRSAFKNNEDHFPRPSSPCRAFFYCLIYRPTLQRYYIFRGIKF